MLKKIFEPQKKFQELIHEPTAFITPFERVKACNIQNIMAIDESIKVMKGVPYGFNENNVIDDMVDAFLFNVNALNILGEDAESFMHRCLTKQKINIDHFISGSRFNKQHDNFLIIVDGVDGVGKSSICEALSQKLGYPIMKMPETNGDIEGFSMFYRKLIAKIDNVMILDRFFPSSLVYGTFFDRDVRIDDIISLNEQREVFVFIIDRENPLRDDLFINEEQWPQIRELFLSQAKQYKWKVIKNDSSIDNCVQRIIEHLQQNIK